MIPWGAITTGIGLASGLFGHHGGGGGGGYRRPPFNFQFDENDPELQYMRHQILLGGQNTHRNTVDELARAGLLGSGKAFDVLNQADLGTQGSLEDAMGSVYGARRAEAHGDYVGDVNYGRGLENRSYEERQGAIGGIGSLAGSFLQDYWRKRMLGGGSGGGGQNDYFTGPPNPYYWR